MAKTTPARKTNICSVAIRASRDLAANAVTGDAVPVVVAAGSVVEFFCDFSSLGVGDCGKSEESTAEEAGAVEEEGEEGLGA